MASRSQYGNKKLEKDDTDMDYFEDLDGNYVSRTALIMASDAKRDVGYDTFNAALGSLKQGGRQPDQSYKMKLCPDDAYAITGGLFRVTELCRQQSATHFVQHNLHSLRIAYQIDATVASTTGIDFDDLASTFSKGKSVKFPLDISHQNGRTTQMRVRVSCDGAGYYWLSAQGNPTTLLNAYNAFAVAMPHTGKHHERRIMMRVPFGVLRRIVRSVDQKFEWHPDTKERINKLRFRNCPAQVFTYLLTVPKSPAEFMSYLRCVFSVPYSNREGYRLLCDDLGIEVLSRRGPDGVQTLLFLFRKGGRIAWSVSFYDKLAKAQVDAEIVDKPVGDDSVHKFLRHALRVDITIHEEGQRQMQHEAKLSNLKDAEIIAANYCRAIKAMDSEEGLSGKRFVTWMLDHVFGELMSFWALLDYSPNKLRTAKKVLEDYNPKTLAGFIEWQNKGFEFLDPDGHSERSISFKQFLYSHAEKSVSRAIARRARQKLLGIKLDPDVPLRAYDAFFSTTFTWDLADEDRHALAQAYERGDHEAAAAIQKQGRANAVKVMGEIRHALHKMIKSAHTPANTLGRPEK